jgi:hypothetical protein
MEGGGADELEPCVRDVAEGGVLTMYLATGKKKHKRYFWVDVQSGLIMWDKKKKYPPNKVEQLVGVEARPAVRDAKEWFRAIDADGSGQLNSDELATLYMRATGEKLGKKQLKQAMHEMDTDGSGAISFEEFAKWWHSNGGDLEKYRDLALTVQTVEVTLLLVAQDADTKRRWVQGLTAVIRLVANTRSPSRADSVDGFGGLQHPVPDSQSTRRSSDDSRPRHPRDGCCAAARGGGPQRGYRRAPCRNSAKCDSQFSADAQGIAGVRNRGCVWSSTTGRLCAGAGT